MKILITTDTYEPMINGVVTSVKNLYNELKRRGHEVKILTLSPDMHNKKDGDIYYFRSFNANRVYPNARGTIPYENGLVEEIIDWKPDIIHTNTELFTFIMALKIAQELKIPMVHTYHTMYEYYTGYVFKIVKVGRRTVSLIMRRVLKNVDAIITPTIKVRESLESYGISKKMAIIPTGINLKPFFEKKDKDEIKKLKEHYGIPLDKKAIFSVGRLGKEKNYDEVIRNFIKLSEKDSNIILVIVGGGPYEHELRNLVKELNISDKVYFTGIVKPQNINIHYELGDIFVSASNSETQGLTYVEALASSKPIICKYDPVLDNIVEQGKNGYTYDTDEEFVEYVYNTLNNEKMYKEMVDYAGKSAEKFSEEKFGEDVEKLYKEVIENFQFERIITKVPGIMARKAARGVKKTFRVLK